MKSKIAKNSRQPTTAARSRLLALEKSNGAGSLNLHDVTPMSIKKAQGKDGARDSLWRDGGISPGIHCPRLHSWLRNDPIRCTGLFECETRAGRIGYRFRASWSLGLLFIRDPTISGTRNRVIHKKRYAYLTNETYG